MRKHSETKPETLHPAAGGVVEFNYNVEAAQEGGYDYDSVDVIGECVRINVKYAMMLECYTEDEINEMENMKRYSDDPDDKQAYALYKETKDGFNQTISDELGPDFK